MITQQLIPGQEGVCFRQIESIQNPLSERGFCISKKVCWGLMDFYGACNKSPKAAPGFTEAALCFSLRIITLRCIIPFLVFSAYIIIRPDVTTIICCESLNINTHSAPFIHDFAMSKIYIYQFPF